MLVEPGEVVRQHELEFGSIEANAVGAGLRQMRHVNDQPRIDVQGDADAIFCDGRPVAQCLVALLLARTKPDLVRVSGDDLRTRPKMHFTRNGVDDRCIAGIDALDDARRLPDGGNTKRLSHDCNMALARTVFDDQTA